MDGEVGVAGASRVGGADFWFEALSSSAGKARADSPLTGRRVAVVSPSAILREAAGRQIEASGARAIKTGRLDEALAQTSASDVILVDQALAKGRASLKPCPAAPPSCCLDLRNAAASPVTAPPVLPAI